MAEESLHLLCMLWADEATIEHHLNGYRLHLKKIDQKILYSTSRPKKVRGYIEAKHFLSIWQQNNATFAHEPPEIAMSYDSLIKNKDGIAHAIATDLSNPKLTKGDCVFDLVFRDKKIPVGTYQNIALFIDWLPTIYCPKPIELVMPHFFS